MINPNDPAYPKGGNNPMKQKENKTRYRAKKNKTGLAQVYISYSAGFSGQLRPCHDSAPDAKAEMTESQVNTLRSIIQRYMSKCRKKNSPKTPENTHIRKEQ